MENTNDKKPGYIFQANYALGQDKNISIHGNFALGATVEEMTAEMDKVFAALEKQRVKRLELPTAMDALEAQKEKLASLKDEVQKTTLKAQAGKLNSAERAQIDNHNQTISRLEELIPKGEAFVADLQQKAA